MAREDRIAFFCGSCSKKYTVPLAMAGRKAKCKACGAGMQVPEGVVPVEPEGEPELRIKVDPVQRSDKYSAPKVKTAPELLEGDEAAMGFFDDQPQAPVAKSRPEARRTASQASPSSSTASKRRKPVKRAADDPLGLEGLEEEGAGPDWSAMLGGSGESSHAEPVVEAETSGPGFSFESAGKSRPSGGKGGGGIGAMQRALMDSFQRGSGSAPWPRRVSFGGLFILLAAVVCLYAASQHSGVEFQSTGSTWGQATTSGVYLDQMQTYSPGMLVGGVGVIIALLLIGRRVYAPRSEGENPLILVLFYGMVLTVAVVTAMSVLGEGETAVLIAGLGNLAVLLAAAVLGGWVIYRIAQDNTGTALGRWLVPAFLIPAGGLVALFVNVLIITEGQADFSAVPWGPVLLGLVLSGVIIFFMGSVVALYLICLAPLVLLLDDRFRLDAGGVIMLCVLLVCLYCYFSVFRENWRQLSKPVAWQLTMLFFGLATMVNLGAAAQRAEFLAEQEQREQRRAQNVESAAMADPGLGSSNDPAMRERVTITGGSGGPTRVTITPGDHIPEARRTYKPILGSDALTTGSDAYPALDGQWPSLGVNPRRRVSLGGEPLDLGLVQISTPAGLERLFGSTSPYRKEVTLFDPETSQHNERLSIRIEFWRSGQQYNDYVLEREFRDHIGRTAGLLDFIEERYGMPAASVQYGTLGRAGSSHCVRIEEFPTMDAQGAGRVHYFGYIPGDDPWLFQIRFSTFRSNPELALRCEAIVRSMRIDLAGLARSRDQDSTGTPDHQPRPEPDPGHPVTPPGEGGEPEEQADPGRGIAERFNQWQSEERMQRHLGEPVKVGEWQLSAPSDLQWFDSGARGARWMAPSGALAMTLRVGRARPEMMDHAEPVFESEDGDLYYMAGPRVSQAPPGTDITYRDQSGLRVWRVLLPFEESDRQARCFYLVKQDETVLEIAVMFDPGEMDQLRAFDAAVASLVPVE